jgi:FMN phosphatase YigB (HAD superfamily)
MKDLFFDAGNTLLLYDYGMVARTVSRTGFEVTADQVMRAEYQVRFEVDRLVAPYLIDPHREIPRMADILPYGNFHAHLLSLIGVPERLIPELDEALREISGALWSSADPGTRGVLDGLKRRGHRLHVISNSDGSVEGLLREAGLRETLEHVFDSHVVGLEKPNPAFFRHAMRTAGARPEQSAYFGDFYSIDYLGSRAAGMTGVLFDRGDLYRHAPCARITHLSQVVSVL